MARIEDPRQQGGMNKGTRIRSLARYFVNMRAAHCIIIVCSMLLVRNAQAQSPATDRVIDASTLTRLEEEVVLLYFDTLTDAKDILLDSELRPFAKQMMLQDLSPPDPEHPKCPVGMGGGVDSLFAALELKAWQQKDAHRFPVEALKQRGTHHIRTTGQRREAEEWVSFSRVTFDADMQRACFYAENVCGGLCGSGWMFLLQKKNGRWTTALKTMLWIS